MYVFQRSGGIFRLKSEKGSCQSDGETGEYANLGAEPLFLCGDLSPHEGCHRKEVSRNNSGHCYFLPLRQSTRRIDN